MLPEVGGLEYIVIIAVALIVVGPKDLPVMLRKVGQWVGKLRGMAAEFRASFDEMARQSELDDLRREVEAMRQGQMAAPPVLAEVNQVFDELGASLKGSGVQFHPPGMSGATEDPIPAPPVPDIAVTDNPKPVARPARKRAPRKVAQDPE